MRIQVTVEVLRVVFCLSSAWEELASTLPTGQTPLYHVGSTLLARLWACADVDLLHHAYSVPQHGMGVNDKMPTISDRRGG